jgi:DNA polymerase-3 subunit alpha
VSENIENHQKRREYTHLHFHTEYSLLDGLNKIKNVAPRLKELGMSAVAMTDHGNMFGAIDFYKSMKKEGIKPIIGMEAYIHNYEKLSDQSSKERFHLCLYAKNEIGYKNLMYLSSQAYLEGYYYSPRINKNILKERKEGLVCTSACLGGEINFHLNLSDKNIQKGAKGYERAKEVALEYKEIFGDDFYLEIMRHGIDLQENIDEQIIQISLETGIKLVATNDTHYTKKEDSEAQEVFMCIGTGKTWSDEERLKHSVHEFYIKSPEEMEEIFLDIPEAIDATNEIADKCNLELKLGDPTPPNFKFTREYSVVDNLELPEKEKEFSFENDDVLFDFQCRKGLEERLKIVPEEEHKKYRDRLELEINTIKKMKFSGYMLIVWDFVRESGEQDIPVGPGRGCLTKDAKVYVSSHKNLNSLEIKSIDKVQKGDFVISHTNSLQKVTETFKYEIEEELYKVETFYGDFLNPIILTGDHKIYLGNNEWKEAKDITTKDWLYLPIPKYIEDRIEEFDLSELDTQNDFEIDENFIKYSFSQNKISSEILQNFNSLENWQDYANNLNRRTIKRYLENNYLFQKFLGRWIGNGYIRKDLNRKEVSVVFHKDDEVGIKETEVFAESNGYQYSKLKNGSIISIHIQDRFLHSLFKSLFMDYKFESNSKYIPEFVFYMSKYEILNVLSGYISADGHSTENRIKITTVSKKLAIQTRKLLLQIGIPSSIRRDENSIYVVNIPANNSIDSIPKERKNIYQIFDDHIKLKVKKVEKLERQKTSVYDFTVENDHSYTTTNYTVHNSAAGSLVAFSLKITDIDPMKYDLLFERFLNPERVSMPDIDMDFAQNRRKDIIRYVQEKYGRENVAQVTTFNSLLAKGAIRDVGRVFELEQREIGNFAKLIPNELNITLDKSFKAEKGIEALIQSDDRFKKVWDIALLLEGLKRNLGVHAAGLVINNEPLWEKTPVYASTKDNEKNFITQYSLNFLEDVDLIKFDFLGLKTLDVIYGAIKLVKEHKGVEIDWHKIDVNDQKVYEFMSSGKTIGMFQIESSGMQELNRRLKPSNFEDVIALIALYRPGPMDSGMLDDFVDRKHGRKKISYPFEGKEFPEQLKEILDPTYGVIVYQEQVMQIVQKIGGFSLGKSDVVRRAMGKKKLEEMQKYKSEFADGAEKQGLDRKIAEELFDLIEKFAGYGFNKSHSAAYAMITFQTAYLKTYYPAEFMASILSTERDNLNKIALYVNEAKSMNIGILPPNIQESKEDFSVIKKGKKEFILFGLGAIKGVGDTALETIVNATKKGKFKDIKDFFNRVNGNKVNKRVLEALIKSGAFDYLKVGEEIYNRQTLWNGIDEILNFSRESGELKKVVEHSLFEEVDDFATNNQEIKLTPAKEFPLRKILEFEKETINFYISGHPLDEYREKIEKFENISNIINIDDFKNWQEAIFIAIVEIVEEKVSKKSGKKFATAKMLDFTGEYTFTIFSKNLEQLYKISEEERKGAIGIKCQLRIDDESGEDERKELMIKEFFSIDQIENYNKDLKSGSKFKKKSNFGVSDKIQDDIVIEAPPPPTDCIVQLSLRDRGEFRDQLVNLKEIANGDNFKGNRRLFLKITIEDQSLTVDTKLQVTDGFESQFRNLIRKV